MMEHIEIHVVHDRTEARLLDLAGLPRLDQIGETCIFCGKPVGSVRGEFIPMALVLNEEAESALCMECSAPVRAVGLASAERRERATSHIES